MFVGALWDAAYRDEKNRSQLLLLVEALPLKSEDWPSYMTLLSKALKAGLSASAEDNRGCNALFILCEKLAFLPYNSYSETIRLVRLLVANDEKGWKITDHSGRSLSDIEDRVPNSCLSVVRNMFLKNIMPNTQYDKVFTTSNNQGRKSMISNQVNVLKGGAGRSASVGRRGLVASGNFDDSVGTWEEIDHNKANKHRSSSLLKSWRNSHSDANVLMSSINGSISTARA